MIRSKLRLIGRFLRALQSINPAIKDFASSLNPNVLDDVEKAINKVGGLDELYGVYASPATAFGLGILLKECTKLLITECIKYENEEKKTRAENFLKLLESELNAKINKTVSENQSERMRQKKVTLPNTDDIKKLVTFLDRKMKYYENDLAKNDYSWDSWINLAQVTLVAILIFNRRRPGELERATITDYNSHSFIDETTNKELFETLSEDAKKLAKQYVRFRIRGKKGRTVTVLLSKQSQICIEKIIAFRTQADVSENNPYIFGIPQRQSNKILPKYLRAYRLLNKYSVECGAKNPSTLRATELRKHIATASIKLNLSEGELEHLQEHMGHADKIHRQFYRQPLLERDILNMSKLLCAAQGEIHQSSSSKSISVSKTDNQFHCNENQETDTLSNINDEMPSVEECSSQESVPEIENVEMELETYSCDTIGSENVQNDSTVNENELIDSRCIDNMNKKLEIQVGDPTVEGNNQIDRKTLDGLHSRSSSKHNLNSSRERSSPESIIHEVLNENLECVAGNELPESSTSLFSSDQAKESTPEKINENLECVARNELPESSTSLFLSHQAMESTPEKINQILEGTSQGVHSGSSSKYNLDSESDRSSSPDSIIQEILNKKRKLLAREELLETSTSSPFPDTSISKKKAYSLEYT